MMTKAAEWLVVWLVELVVNGTAKPTTSVSTAIAVKTTTAVEVLIAWPVAASSGTYWRANN